MSGSESGGVRLDKWLWAARFYKTRALAVDEITKGRVEINGQSAKPSRDMKLGDRVRLRQGVIVREVKVLGISHVRGPAPVAQALYEETPESIKAREKAAEARRLAPEPAQTIADARQGRPTKADRRQLADWNRWSAEADE
jgi:ribosome-associated heat shock protein Hsp15